MHPNLRALFPAEIKIYCVSRRNGIVAVAREAPTHREINP